MVEREDSIFKEDISQRDLDIMTLNVNIEPAFTVEHNMQSERSFDANAETVVHEYRVFRKLTPVKIIILGPPASGKSTLAQRLADYYKISYIALESLTAETIKKLVEYLQQDEHLVPKEVQVKIILFIHTQAEVVEKEMVDVISKEYTKDCGNKRDEVVVGTTGGSNLAGLEGAQRELDEIRNNLRVNNGRLSDDLQNKLSLVYNLIPFLTSDTSLISRGH